MSGTDPAVDLARIIASPLRLAQYLAPKIWGAGAEFRADPWLLKLEAGVVDAIRDRDHLRLVRANTVPQAGKTTFVEIFVPFWTLGLWPETRIILVGYNDTVAQRSGSVVRDLVKQYGPQLFGIDINPDYASKMEWQLAGHQGGMLSVGVGSTITGRSGDLVVLGDLIKNMEEAGSKATKDKIWDEWNGSIFTRKQPGSTYILAATRFSDDDPSGRMEAQEADPNYKGARWESFIFPALAEPSPNDPDAENPEWRDILGRKRGEPLVSRHYHGGLPEERWGESPFHAVKATVDPFTFSALYQQEPTSPTGGMFPLDRWVYYDPEQMPPLMGVRRAWDLAASEGAGDWTVGIKIGKDYEGNFYVLDVQRERLSGLDVKLLVEAVASTDGAHIPIIVERERTGAGKTILEFYQQALPYHTILPGIPDGSKEERARPASILQQGGKLRLPRNADGTEHEWVGVYTNELMRMMGDGRKPRHDDQIDVTAYAVNDMLDETVTILAETSLRYSATRGLMSV